MAGTVNKAILVGYLGRDPEVRTTQGGDKIVNLALATSESWTDRASGERKERTEWHRIVIFNDRIADVAEKYLRKGSQVYIEGSIQTRKWTDQSGTEKYTTEIVVSKFRGELTMLGKNADSQQTAADPPAAAPKAAAPRPAQKAAPASATADLDDTIPF